MSNEFNVIGEHRDDDEHLLVVGEDGQPYDYHVTRETVEPVEVDERWEVDDPQGGIEGIPYANPEPGGLNG